MSDITTQAPVLELLARMTSDSFEASTLDIDTLGLVGAAPFIHRLC